MNVPEQHRQDDETPVGTAGPDAPAASKPYYPAIDFIKTSAILAVILTHSTRNFLDPAFTTTELVVGHLFANFHVPSFLVVSGFLYSSARPLGVGGLWQRLRRVIVPYVIGSLIVYLLGRSPANTWAEFGLVLLTGAALGIYYYIFILTLYILASWILSRCRLWLLDLVLFALCAYALLSALHPALAISESMFWLFRNPLHTFGYFLAGWIGRRRWRTLGPVFARHRLATTAVCFAGVTGYALANRTPPPVEFVGILRAVYTFSMIGLMATWTCTVRTPRPVAYLSRATYPIFLYHFVFIMQFLPLTAAWGNGPRIAANFAIGLAGGLLVAAAGTRLLRGASRPLLGIDPEPRGEEEKTIARASGHPI